MVTFPITAGSSSLVSTANLKKREEKNAVKLWELADIKTLHRLKVEKIKQIYVKQKNYMAKLKKCSDYFFCQKKRLNIPYWICQNNGLI